MQSTAEKPLVFKPRRAIKVTLIILILLFAILIITLSYFVQIEIRLPEDQTLMNYWYGAISSFFLLLGTYIYQYCSQKLVIDTTTMTYYSLLRKRSLALLDIKGVYDAQEVDISGEPTYVKPKFIPKENSAGRKISTFPNRALAAWARANCIDLDSADDAAARADVLADTRLGHTVEKRKAKIKQAERFRDGLNVIGFLLLFTGLFFDLPRSLTLCCILLLSTLILFGILYYKRLVILEWSRARIGVFITVILVSLMSFDLQQNLGFVDVSLSKLRNTFLLGTISVIVISAGYIYFVAGIPNYKFKKIWMPILLFAALFSANYNALNILLGKSEPTLYTTTILEYHKGHYTYDIPSYDYEMRLVLWSEESSAYNEVKVSRDTYKTLAPGTTVNIKEYQGVFGRKWFTVHLNGEELNDYEMYFSSMKQEDLPPWDYEYSNRPIKATKRQNDFEENR